MHVIAAVVLERLAAVVGAVKRDAANIQMILVGGIDADLAEVHRPRVDAVDSRPSLTAVRGLVDTAVLNTIGTLFSLSVLDLAAVPEAVGPVWIATSAA